ncbi:glycoside hydrolase family 3 C-terminal domain-containing protein [Nocardioides daejeonensis]|uniref:glycoside hydrolase family 3 C-terminal domain-containing protein n=1 Tax=Nocardioides daejeonensis TaxID=1046556 RepID=UPI000D7419E7|nr:glycoside hydrolase family 3 C-terminal domain-containing protein [Nocardioides daejeonensis]
MNLTEKAALLSGKDFWHTEAADGAPSVMLTDGPHGLRKQAGEGDHLGLGDSNPATCFPPAVALGASFDPDLVAEVGTMIAAEARAEDVAVVLGPGINLKRSPLCGRNFEYFSEDPHLSGLLGSAWVRGLQSGGVGASLKHFAANNQEHDRLRVSADIDERPLRELYLRAFERVVRDADPWTVMCSYNAINGVLASENPWLLTTVLREEWGYAGLVVSDWGAVRDRVTSLAAGLDLQMPGVGGASDAEVVAAVEAGELDESVVDRSAGRVAALAARAQAAAAERPARPLAALHAEHHDAARRIAGHCIVLLRNEPVGDAPLLPLTPGSRIAVIGEFARTPRYQGAGSSRINPTRLDSALEELRRLHPDLTFTGDDPAEASAAATAAEVAVLFLGLPAEEESEGFDRAHLDLPVEQLDLLAAVLAAQPRTVVVLSAGGVVSVPHPEQVPALVQASLLGQAGGGAVADVLTGRVNPSARLAETVPLRLADSPAFLDFPGERGHVRYGEGVFVGYRWYDARALPVTFPFGHGLSYTTFEHTDLGVHGRPDGLDVQVTITNTGAVTGREVVQVYAGKPASQLTRPPRALVGTAVVELAAGESRVVRVDVPLHALESWFTGYGWAVEAGEYTIEVGASSRDLRARTHVSLDGPDLRPLLHLESTLGEVLEDPVAGPLVAAGLAEMAPDEADDVEGMGQMLMSFPIGRVLTMAGGAVSTADIQALLDAANQAR